MKCPNTIDQLVPRASGGHKIVVWKCGDLDFEHNFVYCPVCNAKHDQHALSVASTPLDRRMSPVVY